MKCVTLFLFCNIFYINTNAQQLTVEETINYIKEQSAKFQRSELKDSIYIGISEYGFISIKTISYYKGSSLSNKEYTDKPNEIFGFTMSDFKFNYKLVRTKLINNNTIEFYSSSSEIQDNRGIASTTCCQSTNTIYDIEGVNKIKNAFDYLLDIDKYDERYNKKDSDPFSPDNYRKKIFVDNNIGPDKQTINLTYNGNLSEINVSICGLLKNMILDSGASDVSISSDTENELFEKGLIAKGNYLTSSLYKLADGSIVKSRRLMLPSLKVGLFTVKDVICCVNPSGDVQLLGKSFLNRFGKWSIDNSTHSLILER